MKSPFNKEKAQRQPKAAKGSPAWSGTSQILVFMAEIPYSDCLDYDPVFFFPKGEGFKGFKCSMDFKQTRSWKNSNLYTKGRQTMAYRPNLAHCLSLYIKFY